jgi:hypothetical protein
MVSSLQVAVCQPGEIPYIMTFRLLASMPASLMLQAVFQEALMQCSS